MPEEGPGGYGFVHLHVHVLGVGLTSPISLGDPEGDSLAHSEVPDPGPRGMLMWNLSTLPSLGYIHLRSHPPTCVYVHARTHTYTHSA